MPVKGTFIHFDIPLILPAPLQRSSTCPSLLHPDLCADSAAGDLCHAMVPRSPCVASGPVSPSSCVKIAVPVAEPSPVAESSVEKSALKSRMHPDAEGRESSPDGISDASTKESAGALDSPNSKESDALQSWTSIPSRKKKNGARIEQRDQVVEQQVTPEPQVSTPVVALQVQAETRSHKGKGKGGKGDFVATGKGELPRTTEVPFAQKPRGKGKGLSHFERIEVGIEDDDEFHIVQRLIGPRGKHMQDITNQCGGAKVWIIGRGSRSWEDSLGPLMICVGAGMKPSFDAAVNLIRELLDRVRVDYKAFLGQ